MIILSDGRVVTPEQFKADHRNVVYSGLYPSTAYLNSIGAKRVLVDPKPEVGEYQVLEFGAIEMRDGVPYQTWVVRDMTEQEIAQKQNAQKAANKQQAGVLLKDTDWVELGDVSDPNRNPHLTNKEAFSLYREQLRAIAVNPPTEPATFPVKPAEIWS